MPQRRVTKLLPALKTSGYVRRMAREMKNANKAKKRKLVDVTSDRLRINQRYHTTYQTGHRRTTKHFQQSSSEPKRDFDPELLHGAFPGL